MNATPVTWLQPQRPVEGGTTYVLPATDKSPEPPPLIHPIPEENR